MQQLNEFWTRDTRKSLCPGKAPAATTARNAPAVHARAKNPIGAAPGQKVVVESSTKKMLWIITLAYMVPVALFLAGYLGGVLLSGSIAVQYTLAVAGFALGLLIAVGYDRRLRRQGGLSFTIVRLF